jgi:hypothetical protein
VCYEPWAGSLELRLRRGKCQYGKDSNTGGHSGLAVGKSGCDGIEPGAYGGGPWDYLRIVVIGLRRQVEFA